MIFYTKSVDEAKAKLINDFKVVDFNIHNVSLAHFYVTSEKLHHLISVKIAKQSPKCFRVEVVE